MELRNYFRILMLLALGILFVNCTSDTVAGPQGPPGEDGIDGIDGVDGTDGTASCVSCHSNATREPIAAGFAVSLHRIGETWEERGFYFGGTACSKCHSGPGYTEFIETGSITPSPALEAPLDCKSCHGSHETFDFENDGPDYALRNTDPTNLDLAPSIALDFGDASNNCITCHQPRNSYEIPALNADGTYTVTSTRFSPHHSPQSTMLEGILGAEIPGDEAYDPAGTFPHRTGSSCVQCHMTPSEDPEIGGHSWNVNEETCVQCHPPIDEAADYTTDKDALLALLLTVEGQAVELDARGEAVLDSTGNVIPIPGETVTGILREDGRSNPGIFSDVAGMAAWNYKTVTEDQSKGVHNPNYTKALLKNSIQALQNEN